MTEPRGGDPLGHATILARDIAERSGDARSVPELYAEALVLVCQRMGWPLGRVSLVERPPSAGRDASSDRGEPAPDPVEPGEEAAPGTTRPVIVPTEIRHVDDPDALARLSEATRALIGDGTALSEQVLDTGSTVWIGDVAREERRLLPADAEVDVLPGAALAMPVLDPSGVRAILHFFDPQLRPRVEDQVEKVQCLGIQLGWMAKLVERDLESRRSRLRLEQVVKAIQTIGAAGMDPDTVMEVTAERAQELTGATSAGVSVQAEDDPNVLVLRGASGNAVPYLGSRTSISDTLSGHAYELGEVLVSSDAVRDARVNQEVVEATGLRALIAVPLKAQGDRPVGLLNVMSNRPHTFDEEDEKLLHLLSEQMGSTLDRARAFRANEHLLEDFSETAEALEEALEEREAILDASLLGIVAMDPQLRVTLWSRAAEELYGWSKEEVLGKSLPILPDFRREEAIRHIQRVLGGVTIRHLDVTHVRKDGSPVEVRLSAAPIRSVTGKAGVVAVIMDMTEIRRVEARLRQAERMESIGRLAGGVAHDFNNVLTAIRGYADLLLAGDLAEEDEESVEHIVEAVHRAESVTRQLLAYSRRQHQEARPVRPSHAIRDMTDLLQRLLEERVTLRFDLADDAGPVLADPAQLDQIVMNLVLNARDSMPDGGEICITCRPVHASAIALADLEADQEQNFVEIAVSDDGQGVAPEIRDRIFEPFFSTKSPGRGTGLGLATVYGLVHQSGGAIRLESEVGVGSTFHVYLPVVDPEVPETPEPIQERRADMPEVLLIESVAMVERLVRRILEPRGYAVRSVPESRQALDLIRSDRKDPDVLITDASRGLEKPAVFLENVHDLRPDLPVLILTDEPERPRFQAGRSAEGSEEAKARPRVVHLLKPFGPDTLTRKIMELLDEPGP